MRHFLKNEYNGNIMMINYKFSTSDASKIIGITVGTIHHWEKIFNEINPIKKQHGFYKRRFYNKKHLLILLIIKTLKYKYGLKTAGIKKYLKQITLNKEFKEY